MLNGTHRHSILLCLNILFLCSLSLFQVLVTARLRWQLPFRYCHHFDPHKAGQPYLHQLHPLPQVSAEGAYSRVTSEARWR